LRPKRPAADRTGEANQPRLFREWIGGRLSQAPASPEQEALLAEFKARHYADWPDRPLPALDNRTPRECVRSVAGRRQVDLLLKNMEHAEHRGPGKPFDFPTIRRDLGLAPR